jgi:hypothetical protein
VKTGTVIASAAPVQPQDRYTVTVRLDDGSDVSLSRKLDDLDVGSTVQVRRDGAAGYSVWDARIGLLVSGVCAVVGTGFFLIGRALGRFDAVNGVNASRVEYADPASRIRTGQPRAMKAMSRCLPPSIHSW